jgi:stearoyl-CoA desaturase (Delta-9 desaturase)
LSNRPWEFDLGWAYIRGLEILGLATVHKVAPKLRFNPGKTSCDMQTVQAILTHRFDVLSRFARSLRRTAVAELRHLRANAVPGLQDAKVFAAVKHWLQRDAVDLPPPEREALDRALRSSTVLQTIHAMRQELATNLWDRSAASKEQLVKQLEDWCRSAEASGIAALQDFSRKLRCYG